MNQIYSSRKLPGYHSPNPQSIKVNLLGAFGILVLCVIAILSNLALIQDLIAMVMGAVTGGEDGTEGLLKGLDNNPLRWAMRLSVLIYLAALIPFLLSAMTFSARRLMRALFDKLDDSSDASVPAEYGSADVVANSMVEKSTIINDDMDVLTKTVFGKNMRFLSRAAGRTAKPVALRLKSSALQVVKTLFKIFVLFLIMLGVGHMLKDTEFMAGLGEGAQAALEQGALIKLLILPIILVIGFAALRMFLDSFFLRLVVPKGAPDTDSRTQSEAMNANMSPYMLINRLPNAFGELEWEGFANRLASFDGERASVTVKDTGDFDSRVLIEQQPEPITSPNIKAGSMWSFAGWLEIALAVIIFGFIILPMPLKAALKPEGELMDVSRLLLPVAILILVALTYGLYNRGKDKVAQGTRLLNAHWFKSPAVFIRLRGTQTKSSVRLGASDKDSIQTDTNIVRTDFLAEAWSSELVSEWVEGAERRYLVALQNTPESKRWLDFAMRTLQGVSGERVVPTGVDLANTETGDVVDANLAVNKARAEVRKGVELDNNISDADHSIETDDDT